MNSRRQWGRALVGIVLAYLVISGNRGLWNLYKLNQERNELSGQVASLKSDISGYEAEYQAYEKNLSIVEKQAREELNLIKPGEMVYRFTKSEKR